MLILGQMPDNIRKMFDAMKAAAAKEQSAAAAGAILQWANFSEFAAGSVSDLVMKNAQRQAFEIVEANWPQWCSRVLTGDIEMIRAYLGGVQAIDTLSSAVGTDQAGKRRILQVLLDAARCASIAYAETESESDLGQEAKALLLACEAAIAKISGKPNEYIAKPLKDDKVPARGAAVKSAVLLWVTELSDFGVVKPKFEPMGTQPAAETPAPLAP
jgi:hypothetical protein